MFLSHLRPVQQERAQGEPQQDVHEQVPPGGRGGRLAPQHQQVGAEEAEGALVGRGGWRGRLYKKRKKTTLIIFLDFWRVH